MGPRLIRSTRRGVLAGAVAAALAPRTAAARDGMRRLGVLELAAADDPVLKAHAAALLQGLAALGWNAGDNLQIDWRPAGGNRVLLEHYAADFILASPDVVLAVGSPAVAALQRLTRTMPIVFTIVTDPVGQGFVASLARPGGNITGFTDFDPPMAAKWLGMVTQIAPAPRRVAALYNPATTPFAGLMMRAIEENAGALPVTVRAAPIDDEAGIDAVVTALSRQRGDGLLVLPDAFTMVKRAAIIAAAERARIPAIYWHSAFAAAGGLIAYGTDNTDLYRRSAVYIDRILKGAKPADLPVQNPTKFELVVNLKTAKALGVTVSPVLLAAADEVIE